MRTANCYINKSVSQEITSERSLRDSHQTLKKKKKGSGSGPALPSAQHARSGARTDRPGREEQAGNGPRYTGKLVFDQGGISGVHVQGVPHPGGPILRGLCSGGPRQEDPACNFNALWLLS